MHVYLHTHIDKLETSPSNPNHNVTTDNEFSVVYILLAPVLAILAPKGESFDLNCHIQCLGVLTGWKAVVLIVVTLLTSHC